MNNSHLQYTYVLYTYVEKFKSSDSLLLNIFNNWDLIFHPLLVVSVLLLHIQVIKTQR